MPGLSLSQRDADVFVPDGWDVEPALARTSHLAVGAHQDDLEIFAYHGIAACFGRADQWFCGVTVTDGAGSPRTGPYAGTSDDEMRRLRRDEQRKAATIGGYGAMVQLDHPSRAVKDPTHADAVEDLKTILLAARPRVVYTHNPADKHDTHVAVFAKTLAALRALPADARPETFYGCEVWGDLDWLSDADKVVLDVSANEHLAAALLGVFDSQIAGGKRYDLGVLGRRRANATFFQSHGTDTAVATTFAMDLMPLLRDPNLTPVALVARHLRTAADAIAARISRLDGPFA